MRITYLILTWNRIDALRRHLELLLKQTYTGPFEVIVCVDGSTDGTQKMLADWQYNERFILKWFDTGNINKNTAAQAKNLGIKNAVGELIIMVDDDCLPHQELIKAYVGNYNPKDIQLGYKSNFESYLYTTIPVSIEPGLMKTWWDDWQAGRFGHFQCGNVAMSIEAAKTLAKDGSIGFDERFMGYGHEDTELGYRLHDAGFKFVFNPAAVVYHLHPGTTPQQAPEMKEADRVRSNARLQQILHEPAAKPYPEFNDLTGMMTIEELQWLYQIAGEMTSIVEVGSWQGRSAHALLSGCRGTVYVVDQWDPEYVGVHGLSRQAMVDSRRAFFSNLGGFNNLQVLEMASVNAAKAFQDKSVDMVFIDADHAYGSLIADIQAWLPKTIKIICGHDYSESDHPGVVQAVDEIFGGAHKLCGSIWSVRLESMEKKTGKEKEVAENEAETKQIKRPPHDRMIREEDAVTK